MTTETKLKEIAEAVQENIVRAMGRYIECASKSKTGTVTVTPDYYAREAVVANARVEAFREVLRMLPRQEAVSA